MKPMPDAHDNGRPADVQSGKADKLPPGKQQNARRKKDSELESSAHSNDWRNANLYPPK